MFNRKKHLIKPPIFDKHRIFNMMLEERGWYKINNDRIVLFPDKYMSVEFTYLEFYYSDTIYLN
jgi:hypothetical protein